MSPGLMLSRPKCLIFALTVSDMPRMNIGSPMPIEIVSPSGVNSPVVKSSLVDDDVVGGAHEVGLHFLGHRDDAVAHDLGHHRIGLALGTQLALGARLARSRFGRELGLLLRHGVYRPPATA